jgi:hypothetical protein
MKPELAEFDVWPRIVRAGREAEIMIRPLYDPARFDPPAAVHLTMFAAGGLPGQTGSPAGAELLPEKVAGGLGFRYSFDNEQEYILFVEVTTGQARPRSYEFRFYAVQEDLFARLPYKGDLHMHSMRSDGREPPAYVAGACRRIGMDFMAVTDHRLYAPSLEAQQAYAGMPIDLRIYPGEEVHPPDNPLHIINFGGSFSLNEIFRQEEPRYRAEVVQIAAGLSDFPLGVDRSIYASCEWCYRQIRAAGGLGILCHPYWFTRHRYDVSETLVTLLLERQPYDALEVIGGYHLFEAESNDLQVARYHEERARGRRIPLVGVSDAHGCERDELFGWYYTVVFSPSLDLPDLIASIKELHSVAVDALPGSPPRITGPFRLACYAHFLLREIFPLHDALCLEEGRSMLAALTGDLQSRYLLAAFQGRAAALYNHLWNV